MDSHVCLSDFLANKDFRVLNNFLNERKYMYSRSKAVAGKSNSSRHNSTSTDMAQKLDVLALQRRAEL